MCHGLFKLNKSRLMKFAFVCGCWIWVGAADADDMAVAEGSQAPVIHFGGVSAYPGFSIAEKSNDNIFKRDTNKKSSLVTVFNPSVLLQAKKGADVYSLTYSPEIGRYSQSSADNYVDQDIQGNAQMYFAERASVQLTPEFKSAHDDRGSDYGPATPSPNKYQDAGIDGSFTYGNRESKGRIVLSASYHNIKYQNNRTVTTAYDRNLNNAGGTFYYRMSPAVYSFIQLDNTRIAYKDVASTLSGNEIRYLLGATWEATAQTTGSLKIGQLEKKFDSAARQTFRGSSWEGDITWSPRSFVRLEWLTGRKSVESTGVGDFVLLTSNSLDLGYDLSELTTVHLKAARQTEDFAQTTRSDKTPSYGVKVDYKLRSWLVAGAEFTNSVKTSTGYTGASPDYHNKIFMLSLHSEL